MKNTVKQNALLLVALVTGALGCILYLLLRLLGTDSNGFLQTGHPFAILLFLLTGAAMIGFAIALRQIKGTPTYVHVFPLAKSGAIGHFIAAAGIFFTCIINPASHEDAIGIFGVVTGVVGTVSFVYMGLCRMGKLPPNHNFYILIIPYFIVNLVGQYRLWSNEPEFLRYFFLLFSNIFLMFTAYYRACLFAGRNVRRAYAFCHCCGVFFCGVCAVGANRLYYVCMLLWLYLDWFSLSPKKAAVPMPLPKEVLYCLEKLQQNGHTAYVVGGCVRDFLLGLIPHDYDMCTDAKPEQIAAIFSEHSLVRSGEKHGTIGVVLDSTVFEITTFRTEGGYADSRHPDWVNFVSTVEEDLGRRDFTINAIAFSPACGYIDPWDGQVDLEDRLLRAVGEPTVRFKEDSLRILRGVRFAATYKLKVDENTKDAMIAQAPNMDSLARERVFGELSKLLLVASAEDLIDFAPVITRIIPELAPAVGFQQHSPHHNHDVFTHIAHTVNAVSPDLPLRLAALLHDVGKPATFVTDENGRGHFYNHAEVGAKIAEDILLRLKAPTALRKQVVFLIANHMTTLIPDKRALQRHISHCGEPLFLMLLELQEADCSSKGTDEHTDLFVQIRALLAEIREEDACLHIKDLAINGDDLILLGFAPGPAIGECLNHLMELVQNETIPNSKAELITAAERFLSR